MGEVASIKDVRGIELHFPTEVDWDNYKHIVTVLLQEYLQNFWI